MKVAPFRIERFYARFEFATRYMLSSSDCESRTIEELLSLEPDAESRLRECWCGYTESSGALDLREAIAALYTEIDPSEVVVTSCAEEALFLVNHAVLEAGAHAIVETPCYESALVLPQSSGAEVSRWERWYDEDWSHDLHALRSLFRASTALVYVNQPHNPTGTLMGVDDFLALAETTDAGRAILLSDEVYRELEHDSAARLPAACDVSASAISIGSISKSYGLPGLRIGWIATRDARIRKAVLQLKDYTTICASAPSELLTAIALRNREQLLARNLEIVNRNLKLVDEFLVRHSDLLEWVRPTATAIGFPRLSGIDDVDRFCEDLAVHSDVLLLPGSVYDAPRHVRLGFGRADLPEALPILEAALTPSG